MGFKPELFNNVTNGKATANPMLMFDSSDFVIKVDTLESGGSPENSFAIWVNEDGYSAPNVAGLVDVPYDYNVDWVTAQLILG